MAKVRVKIRSSEARKLLRSDEVAEDLLERAKRIQQAAGRGFVADVQQGKTRARAMVKSTDYRSRYVQARDNTLLKAVDAGR